MRTPPSATRPSMTRLAAATRPPALLAAATLAALLALAGAGHGQEVGRAAPGAVRDAVAHQPDVAQQATVVGQGTFGEALARERSTDRWLLEALGTRDGIGRAPRLGGRDNAPDPGVTPPRHHVTTIKPLCDVKMVLT